MQVQNCCLLVKTIAFFAVLVAVAVAVVVAKAPYCGSGVDQVVVKVDLKPLYRGLE